MVALFFRPRLSQPRSSLCLRPPMKRWATSPGPSCASTTRRPRAVPAKYSWYTNPARTTPRARVARPGSTWSGSAGSAWRQRWPLIPPIRRSQGPRPMMTRPSGMARPNAMTGSLSGKKKRSSPTPTTSYCLSNRWKTSSAKGFSRRSLRAGKNTGSGWSRAHSKKASVICTKNAAFTLTRIPGSRWPAKITMPGTTCGACASPMVRSCMIGKAAPLPLVHMTCCRRSTT